MKYAANFLPKGQFSKNFENPPDFDDRGMIQSQRYRKLVLYMIQSGIQYDKIMYII